jgi:hypothetical protein
MQETTKKETNRINVLVILKTANVMTTATQKQPMAIRPKMKLTHILVVASPPYQM